MRKYKGIPSDELFFNSREVVVIIDDIHDWRFFKLNIGILEYIIALVGHC